MFIDKCHAYLMHKGNQLFAKNKIFLRFFPIRS